jgi:hypothetical protein
LACDGQGHSMLEVGSFHLINGTPQHNWNDDDDKAIPQNRNPGRRRKDQCVLKGVSISVEMGLKILTLEEMLVCCFI